jgi:chromosome segregation ATPase
MELIAIITNLSLLLLFTKLTTSAANQLSFFPFFDSIRTMMHQCDNEACRKLKEEVGELRKKLKESEKDCRFLEGCRKDNFDRINGLQGKMDMLKEERDELIMTMDSMRLKHKDHIKETAAEFFKEREKNITLRNDVAYYKKKAKIWKAESSRLEAIKAAMVQTNRILARDLDDMMKRFRDAEGKLHEKDKMWRKIHDELIEFLESKARKPKEDSDDEEEDDDDEEDDEEDSHPEIVDCTKDDNDNGSVETKVVSEGGVDEAGTKRTLDGKADNGAKKARLAMTLNKAEKRGAV